MSEIPEAGNYSSRKPKKSIHSHKSERRYIWLILELLMVSFGVFLGFLANEYQDKKQTAKKIDEALKIVDLEIKENLKEAERLYIDNRASNLMMFYNLDSIDYYISRHYSLQDFYRGSISLYSPSKTAWETFKQQGLASYVEFKRVAAISEIYTYIYFIEQINSQLLGIMSNGDLYDYRKINQSLMTLLSLTNQLMNIDVEIRNSIVDYYLGYNTSMLSDTSDFNKIRIEHINELKETNYVKKH